MAPNRNRRPPKRRYENKRRRLSQADQFAQIYNNVIKSDAWRNCSGGAIKVFMHLGTRCHGTNNGALAASMRDIGSACGFSKDKACRCISELLDWKLIEVVTPGSYGGRKATEYSIMIWDCHVTGRPAVTSWEPAQSHQQDSSVAPVRTVASPSAQRS
jgi:hypothetical protein